MRVHSYRCTARDFCEQAAILQKKQETIEKLSIGETVGEPLEPAAAHSVRSAARHGSRERFLRRPLASGTSFAIMKMFIRLR